VTAFNDLTAFAKEQRIEAGKGTPGALGHNALLRSTARDAAVDPWRTRGEGTFHRLSQIGIEFSRTGELTLEQAGV
jgi:hypothetical protein